MNMLVEERRAQITDVALSADARETHPWMTSTVSVHFEALRHNRFSKKSLH